mgnify:CR=1 FL=1|tara:strand:- start:68 stop:289 length:222 start_codon:yes stop_codon:yes gene_type:complete
MNRKDFNKKVYELFISPEINKFNLGETVKTRDCFGNEDIGYIENFNADGTIFIKKNISDMGRDYDRIFVSKIS